jgi:hypothetical protein
MKITQIDLQLPRPELEQVCKDCARLVGPGRQSQPVEQTLAAVSDFVFIRDERFGEQIDLALGLTGRPGRAIDDGRRMVAGKAIASSGPEGVTTRVLIPSTIILPILFPLGELPITIEENRYIISHEIGHAVDFAARQVVPPEEWLRAATWATPFRIEDTTRYYSLRLGFEVAASANSARAVSRAVHSHRYESVLEGASRPAKYIDSELAKLRNGTAERRYVSHVVSHELWDSLTEFAKIFATIIVNDRLTGDCGHPWVGKRWEAALHRHLDVVRALVDQYPQWSADTMLPIRDVLQTLALDRFGCQFVQGESEDCVVVVGD